MHARARQEGASEVRREHGNGGMQPGGCVRAVVAARRRRGMHMQAQGNPEARQRGRAYGPRRPHVRHLRLVSGARLTLTSCELSVAGQHHDRAEATN